MIELAKMPSLKIQDSEDKVVIDGKEFNVTFDRKSGMLKSYNYQGHEFIHSNPGNLSGPVLNVYRAPLDNDVRVKDTWDLAGLSDLKHELISFDFQKMEPQVIQLHIESKYKAKDGKGFNHFCTYTIFGNGDVFMDNYIEPFGELPTLPRIGFEMIVPAEFENFCWYGRGPHENYADRKTGAAVGMYKSTVNDQYVPYVKPQDNGSKQDVRWAALLNDENTGLVIVSRNALFSMTALHYSIHDLEKTRHTNELQRSNDIFIHIDARQRGVGNASCGPDILEKYKVEPEPTRFSFSFRPYNSEKDDLAAFCRSVLPITAEPIIKRDKQGMVTMNAGLENVLIRYTLDGSEPTSASLVYNAPFTKIDKGIIKARAFTQNMLTSRTVTLNVKQLDVITPVIFPQDTYFADSVLVKINSETDGAEIYYTVNGSIPDQNSMHYKKPFNINKSMEIKAIALKRGYKPSQVASSQIEIRIPQADGIDYRYYEGSWQRLPDFKMLTPVKTGHVSQIKLDNIEIRKELFGIEYSGFINIKEAGEYTFFLQSNDGSKLFVDAVEVVDNGGQHGALVKQGTIQLDVGKHPIQVYYFDAGGSHMIKVSIQSASMEKQEIPVEMYLR